MLSKQYFMPISPIVPTRPLNQIIIIHEAPPNKTINLQSAFNNFGDNFEELFM